MRTLISDNTQTAGEGRSRLSHVPVRVTLRLGASCTRTLVLNAARALENHVSISAISGGGADQPMLRHSTIHGCCV